jgi:DNA-binding transcriptional ArsR family regulator
VTTNYSPAGAAAAPAGAAPGPIDALGALGDPTRRAIFERLGERPRAVGDIAALLPVSRPAVSQHLKVLKEARLVRDIQDGTRRVYSLDPVGIAGLRDYLDRFWNTALHAFKTRVEVVQHESQQQSQEEDTR